MLISVFFFLKVHQRPSSVCLLLRSDPNQHWEEMSLGASPLSKPHLQVPSSITKRRPEPNPGRGSEAPAGSSPNCFPVSILCLVPRRHRAGEQRPLPVWNGTVVLGDPPRKPQLQPQDAERDTQPVDTRATHSREMTQHEGDA